MANFRIIALAKPVLVRILMGPMGVWYDRGIKDRTEERIVKLIIIIMQ